MSDRPVPRRSWLAVVLLASLAINALTVGMLIGSGFAVPMLRAQAPAGPPAWGGFGNSVNQLPQAERRRLMVAMRPYRPDIRAARLALGDARARLAATIAQPEFNVAAASAAFADVRIHAAALQERIQEATAAALQTLSPQSRRVLADAVHGSN